MKIVFDVFKKWGLAVLFLLLGITWILINPLMCYAAEPDFFKAMETTPWENVGATTWIASLIYIAIGVMLLLRTFKPSVKIPDIAYPVALGAVALLALIDVFTLKGRFPQGYFDFFKDLPKEIQTHIVMSYISAILSFVALAGGVALFFLKDKFGKFYYIPGGVGAAGALFSAIGNIAYSSQFKDRIMEWDRPVLVMQVIFALVLAAALFFFCYFFVAENNAEGEVVEETETQTDISFAEENEFAPTTESAPQPKLSAAQQAELDNAKELFELGAYSEEEFEEEKKRIMLGL